MATLFLPDLNVHPTAHQIPKLLLLPYIRNRDPSQKTDMGEATGGAKILV